MTLGSNISLIPRHLPDRFKAALVVVAALRHALSPVLLHAVSLHVLRLHGLVLHALALHLLALSLSRLMLGLSLHLLALVLMRRFLLGMSLHGLALSLGMHGLVLRLSLRALRLMALVLRWLVLFSLGMHLSGALALHGLAILLHGLVGCAIFCLRLHVLFLMGLRLGALLLFALGFLAGVGVHVALLVCHVFFLLCGHACASLVMKPGPTHATTCLPQG